ncbi:hypothetical protein [Bradyrhizobium stylosanthis]|uniref:hypothetical protein n=1 Tax=Bradyrhizobium stylosanthis TaxID=1803665 RepID=UPI00119E65F6|nr:hypothetical protein [Bradyrhizobium stylosanthis]
MLTTASGSGGIDQKKATSAHQSQGRRAEQIKAIRRHFCRGNDGAAWKKAFRDSDLGTFGLNAINTLSPIAR